MMGFREILKPDKQYGVENMRGNCDA